MSWMPQPPRPTPPVVRPSRQSAAFAKRGRSRRRIAWFTPTQVGNTWRRGCPHPLSSVHPKPVGNTLHPSKRAGDVSPPLGRSLQRPIVLNRPIHIRRSPKPPPVGPTSVGRPGNAVRPNPPQWGRLQSAVLVMPCAAPRFQRPTPVQRQHLNLRDNPAQVQAIGILLNRPADWSPQAPAELRKKLTAARRALYI